MDLGRALDLKNGVEAPEDDAVVDVDGLHEGEEVRAPLPEVHQVRVARPWSHRIRSVREEKGWIVERRPGTGM